MKARLTFLSGPHRGQRRIVRDRIIGIGGDPSHLIYLPNLPTSDLLAVIEESDCTYRIAASHALASLAVNGRAVDEAVLQDGDVIQIANAHKIRFGVVPERGDPCKPMRDIARHSWRTAAALEATPAAQALFFLRDLSHSTALDASRATRLGWAVTLVAVVLASVLGIVSLMHAQAAARRVVALGAEVAAGAASRERLEQQVMRLRQLEHEKAQTEARLGEVSRTLETAEKRLARLERQTPDLLASIEVARRSVGFLLVGYALYERASGKPLRFVSVDANGNPEPDENGKYQTSIDGDGPIVTSHVTGSGFVIAGSRIVTNRHVVEPWWKDESVKAVVQRGFVPRRTLMRAYFPHLSRPLGLRLTRVSSEADVAMIEAAIPAELAPLTLADPRRRVSAGDLVVVVGYPTGFDALLAKTDEAVARKVIESSGEDPTALANALARRQLITPLVTVGHVGDVRGRTIVYDAATTHGSSGGPVLNAAGEVIALSVAGLPGFVGARFGIPIDFVHRMMEERPGARKQQ